MEEIIKARGGRFWLSPDLPLVGGGGRDGEDQRGVWDSFCRAVGHK